MIIALVPARQSSATKNLPILRHGCAGSGQGGLILDASRELGRGVVPFVSRAPDLGLTITGQVLGGGDDAVL